MKNNNMLQGLTKVEDCTKREQLHFKLHIKLNFIDRLKILIGKQLRYEKITYLKKDIYVIPEDVSLKSKFKIDKSKSKVTKINRYASNTFVTGLETSLKIGEKDVIYKYNKHIDDKIIIQKIK